MLVLPCGTSGLLWRRGRVLASEIEDSDLNHNREEEFFFTCYTYKGRIDESYKK